VREVNNLAVDWCGYWGEQVLDRSETPDGLKHAIEGRIQALANVHSLFVKSRWIGAELSTIAWQELTPYIQKNEAQVRIQGPQVLLEPNTAQAIAVTSHELATMLPSMALCLPSKARLRSSGRVRRMDTSSSAGQRPAGRP
jgi:hypothetical protein